MKNKNNILKQLNKASVLMDEIICEIAEEEKDVTFQMFKDIEKRIFQLNLLFKGSNIIIGVSQVQIDDAFYMLTVSGLTPSKELPIGAIEINIGWQEEENGAVGWVSAMRDRTKHPHSDDEDILGKSNDGNGIIKWSDVISLLEKYKTKEEKRCKNS